MKSRLIFLIVLGICGSSVAYAKDEQVCLYATPDGQIKQVTGLDAVPPQYRDHAQCAKKTDSYLARPEEVKLDGTVRKEQWSSSLGPIEMRWPRKVEQLFGRTPQRAVEDAATTVSRALKASSFPAKLQTLNLNWRIVFMDEDLPDTQIPRQLISNCHPAWMTPPANLYVVSQRVVAGCSGSRPATSSHVGDAALADILIHEMGHAVEGQLLGPLQDGDNVRAEGFATWFEQYATDYSSVIGHGTIKAQHFAAAKQAIQESPNAFNFDGTILGYSRASLWFAAIAERRGIKSLMDVYETMATDKIDFFSAADKKIGWDQKRFNKETLRLVGLGN